MGKLTYRKQIENWMEEDGFPTTEKYVAPIFKNVMFNVDKRGMDLRTSYERERPNIEEKLKDEKVQKGQLYWMEAEETFFIQKNKDTGKISFQCGYTSLDMSTK